MDALVNDIVLGRVDRADGVQRPVFCGRIELEPDRAEFVMSVNGGNQTVPTLLFADGSAATNPSIHEVRARLS